MLDPARMDDVLRRGGDVATAVGAWKSLDERRRKLQGELDGLRQQFNAANAKNAKLDKKSDEFKAAIAETKLVSAKIKEGEAELAKLEQESSAQLLAIPNAPHDSVPLGAGDADNPVLHVWGTKPTYTFAPKTHADLGPPLGLDFEAGVRIAGSRFTVLRDAASRLTRGLIN